MNKTFYKNSLLTAALWFMVSLQGFANSYQNLYLRAEAYPTGAGKVYVSSDYEAKDNGKLDLQPVSELKESQQYGAAYIWSEPAEGYLLAGYARDNGNGVFDDNGIDTQVSVNRKSGYFDPVLDEEEFENPNGTTQSQHDAEEALEFLEDPTDYIFAVFTKGDVACLADDSYASDGSDYFGKVFASKLDNKVGETVTFTVKPDKNRHLARWTNSAGVTVSTKPGIKVGVKGGEIYYAHFASGAPAEGEEDVIDDLTDAIEGIKAEAGKDAGATYDLSGRMVKAGKQGIYIQKGKKIARK